MHLQGEGQLVHSVHGFCGAKIPPKTEAERNLLRLKGEMGKTSAEALSIVRGAQVDGWRAVLD